MHTIYQGATTNIAIHRKFLAKSRHYQAHAQSEASAQTKDDSDADVDDIEEEGEAERGEDGLPVFSKLSEAHLNNTALLKNRILKLIKGCPNQIIHHKYIFVRIGFDAGNKFIRRCIGRLLSRMIVEGYLERCSIKAHKRGVILNCLRIPDDNDSASKAESIVNEDVGDINVGDDDEDDEDDESSDSYGITLAVAIEKQITNIVLDSGVSGITMTVSEPLDFMICLPSCRQ